MLARNSLIVLLTFGAFIPAITFKLDNNRVKRTADDNCGGFSITGDCGKTSSSSSKSCPIDFSGSNAPNREQASNIAMKAAQAAKAASDAQTSAGEAAAREVKQRLALKAKAAASAAEAALAGKQQVLDQLEAEVREAESLVAEEAASLQITSCNTNAAVQSARQAGIQVKTITDAVHIAQENVQNAEVALTGAQQEVIEKQQLSDASKNRVKELLRQLDQARSDYKKTKKAAELAACAAREARQRVARDRRMAEVYAKLRRVRRHHKND